MYLFSISPTKNTCWFTRTSLSFCSNAVISILYDDDDDTDDDDDYDGSGVGNDREYGADKGDNDRR